MKKRRLNVLFIAVIALAAAPQALRDAHRLVNAAQDRAETEFWSVFLSYQAPAENVKTAGRTELIAALQQESACPLERMQRTVEAVRNSRSNEIRVRLRASAEAARANAKPEATEADEADVDNTEALASADDMPEATFPEEEQKLLKSANLHNRDTEKAQDAASKASLASFIEGNEEFRIKVRQTMELDKLLRARPRPLKGRAPSPDEIPMPNTVGSM